MYFGSLDKFCVIIEEPNMELSSCLKPGDNREMDPYSFIFYFGNIFRNLKHCFLRHSRLKFVDVHIVGHASIYLVINICMHAIFLVLFS